MTLPPVGDYGNNIVLPMGGGINLTPTRAWTNWAVGEDEDGRFLRCASGDFYSFLADATETPASGYVPEVVIRVVCRQASFYTMQQVMDAHREHANGVSGYVRSGSRTSVSSLYESEFTHGSVGEHNVLYHQVDQAERRVIILPSPTPRIAWATSPTVTPDPLSIASYWNLDPVGVVPCAVPTSISLSPGSPAWLRLYRYDIWNGIAAPTKGMWGMRQRQSLAGNAGGWPLRQRQNGGATGSWPLRQRQTGL